MSSSLILTEQLDKESAVFKEEITQFIDEKTKEFNMLMKTSIDNFVDKKLHAFYARPFDMESALFDTAGASIVKRYTDWCPSYAYHSTKLNGVKRYTDWCSSYAYDSTKLNGEKNRIAQYETQKCFAISKMNYTGNGNNVCEYYFFRDIIVTYNYGPCMSPTYTITKHKLTMDILFAIKHFQLESEQSQSKIQQILTLYDKHPEFFRGNSANFERICHKEYDDIAKMKAELAQLIQDHQDNKSYYAGLEKEIEEIEDREDKIEEEREKLAEEKRQLLLVKKKLDGMKAELEKEREKLEAVKAKREIDDIHLDDYFQEIIDQLDAESTT